MLKLTIDRATWYRGLGPKGSYLCRKKDGHKCCLGFDALLCGYTIEQITGRKSPSDLNWTPGDNNLPGLMKADACQTDVCAFMMAVNDAPIHRGEVWLSDKLHVDGLDQYAHRGSLFQVTSEEQREAILTLCFRSIGREVTFIN